MMHNGKVVLWLCSRRQKGAEALKQGNCCQRDRISPLWATAWVCNSPEGEFFGRILLCGDNPRKRWVLKEEILRMIVMRVLKYWVLQFKFLMREGEWPCGTLDSEPAANVPESGIGNKLNLNANDGEWEWRCKAQKRSWGIEQGNCCQGDCAVSRRKYLKLFSNGPRVNPICGWIWTDWERLFFEHLLWPWFEMLFLLRVP